MTRQAVRTARIADWHRLMHRAGWHRTDDGGYRHGDVILSPEWVAEREAMVARTGVKLVPSGGAYAMN